MVYTKAGIVVGIFGLAMVAFPQAVLRYQRWRFPEDTIDNSPERIRTVRYGGIVFLAIAAAFVGGDQLGLF